MSERKNENGGRRNRKRKHKIRNKGIRKGKNVKKRKK